VRRATVSASATTTCTSGTATCMNGSAGMAAARMTTTASRMGGLWRRGESRGRECRCKKHDRNSDSELRHNGLHSFITLARHHARKYRPCAKRRHVHSNNTPMPLLFHAKQPASG
jgi:hypothetical protein